MIAGYQTTCHVFLNDKFGNLAYNSDAVAKDVLFVVGGNVNYTTIAGEIPSSLLAAHPHPVSHFCDLVQCQCDYAFLLLKCGSLR